MNTQIGGIERLYVEKYSLYKEFADRIQLLMQDLIQRDDIEIYKIETKTKTPGELIKSVALMREFPSSFEQLPDVITVGILLRFPEDVGKVEKIITEEFIFDPKRSTPAKRLDDPARFGYPAANYVLSLSNSRSSLREWRKYNGLIFRLDVRTMLQEVWAAVAPRVNVSVDSAMRKKMERKLLRLAALLEEADEGFLSLYESSKGESLPVSSAEPFGFSGMRDEPPVVEASRVYNIEELYEWFSARPDLANEWSNAAIKAGFPIFVPSPDYLRTSFENLYTILKAADIDTLDEVDAFISDLRADDKGVAQLQSINSTFQKDVGNWKVDAYSALFLLVLNLKWDILKEKDLAAMGVKKGSDRISGITQ